MKKFRTFFSIITIVLIAAFFVVFINYGKNSAVYETIFNENWTQDIVVTDSMPDSAGLSKTISIPEDGKYRISVDVVADAYSFIHGIVIKDKDGNALTSMTAGSMTGWSEEFDLKAGTCTVEFDYLANGDGFRDFAKQYYTFSNDQQLEQAVKNADFETMEKNAIDKVEYMVEAEKVGDALPEVKRNTFILLFVITVLMTFTVLAAGMPDAEEPETDLKRRLGGTGVRYALFFVAVFGFQILFSLGADILKPGYVDDHMVAFQLLATFLSVDVVGFPVIYLASRKIPVKKIEEHGIGAKWLLYLLLSFGIMVPGAVIGAAFQLLLSGSSTSPITGILFSSSVIPRILVVGIGAPIFEELIFRKLLCDRLYKYGEFVCVLLSGLMFGLFHGNLSQFFYATGLGMLFAFVYLRTGRIRYTIALHMTVNLASSVITAGLMNAIMDENGQVITDSPMVPVFGLWMLLYAGMGFVGVVTLIILFAKKKLALVSRPSEPGRIETIKAMLTSPEMWMFYAGCIGIFVYSYLGI